ncbi:MAG: PQQ-binding-like beta-propeller repeat protein [Chthoniobacterales bacterium]|nr:PQQ-binding-like beta-propeller repeat protein [Chthoniobacterales bacterium]
MKRSLPHLIAVALTPVFLATLATAAAQSSDWNGYLHDPAHSSHNARATAITQANATTLVPDWTFVDPQPTLQGQPVASLYSTPTVSNGVVYIGSNTGMFYALNETTGALLWQQLLGFTTPKSCGSGHGVVSAAAVATDPVSGTLTVYVAGGDGYLYALDAATGNVVFRQFVTDVGTNQNTGFIWASPTIQRGTIYLGFASACDHPLVRSALNSFDQHTGALLRTFWTLPEGSIGAGVWSTAASDGKSLWITTGNGSPGGHSFAIAKLQANNLRFLTEWINPLNGDLDWGSSPTLFQATINNVATRMVGANGKDGIFHAFDRDHLENGPIWSFQVGTTEDFAIGTCLAAPIWDSTSRTLFVAGNLTTIGATQFSGSVRAFNPADGSIIWETGLTGGPIMGSPTLNGTGVLAAATYNIADITLNAVYLLNASNGAILATIPEPNNIIFGQPVFAGDHLFIASSAPKTSQGSLTAFIPAALKSARK